MNKLFPILGLAAGGLLLLGSKKSASASVTPPGSTNPTAKEKLRAEYQAAIAHAMNGSYEDLIKVLNAAVKAGVITQAEAAAYQKKHPKFPKGSSGSSATTAKPKSDLDKRIATALATNNPQVIRDLAKELERTSPDVPKETIAALYKAADDLDKALKQGQESAPPVLPPVAPAPAKPKPQVSVAKPKKPAPKPKKTDVEYNPVEHAPASNADSKQLALDVAKHLTGRAKGKEDKALIEKYQRNENRVRVANDQEAGLNPDGKYGLETAMSLADYDLVPPKPLYWGKDGTYASYTAERKQWNDWCLAKAKADPARAAEWTAASKV